MATLNKAPLEPADAREIVKYLSDNLGLAPEEAKPGAFEVERRLIDYKYAGATPTPNDVCSQLPLDGPRDPAAPNRGRVESARRHASGLLPAGGLPGVSPRRARRRANPAPTVGRPTTGIRWTRRSRI